MSLTTLAAAAAALLLVLSPSPDEAAPAPRTGNVYTLIVLRTGPATDLPDDARREAFEGHFANMGRMAEAGDLLVAGPFGPPMAREGLRGLFVIDRATVAEGLAVAGSDPTTEAGVFVQDGYRLTTDAPLRDLPGLEKEDEARRLADPDVPDAWEGRGYVLAIAPFDAAVFARAKTAEGVAVAARVHGWEADGADAMLLWLDAETPDEAKALVPEGAGWALQGWYGSRCVGRLGEE